MSINKKVVLIVCLIIFIALIVFGGMVGHRYNILNKIYNNNVGGKLGNNYCITTILNGEVEYITSCKDGVEMMIFANGDVIWDNGHEAYTIYNNEQKYEPREIIGESFVNIGESGRGFGFQFNLTHSETPILAYSLNIIGKNIKTEELDGKEHYIIKTKPKVGEETTLWVDKATLLVRKFETMASIAYNTETDEHTLEPYVIEFIVETNVVTAEEVAKPNLEGYDLINSFLHPVN